MATISVEWPSWGPGFPFANSSTTANVQPDELADTFVRNTYPRLYANAKHTVVKPGDRISVSGLDVRVLASAGETIKTAFPGGGTPNFYCANFEPGDIKRRGPQSVGIYVTFGKFRHSFGESDQEHGVRADVSNQSLWRRGCALGFAPRAGQLEFGGAGTRSSPLG
jgi:hypothetical protein